MAGKVLYKLGRHPSRDGIGRPGITISGAMKLRAEIDGMLEKRITENDFRQLLEAICLAKAESGDVRNEVGGVLTNHAMYFDHVSRKPVEFEIQENVMPPVRYDVVRRKDIEAQLRAMRKICNDDVLINALRSCDTWTFSVINMASIDVMSDMLWERGEFIDADGEARRIPRSIYAGSVDIPAILPLGVTGLRDAIERALATLDGDQNAGSSEFRNALEKMPILAKGRGPREKPYQSVLADECITLWKKYGRTSRRKPWVTTGTDRRSGIVIFSEVVFKAAGMDLSPRRLVTLLQLARKTKAANLGRYRRFIAKLRKRAN